jgi:hypothetical protein
MGKKPKAEKSPGQSGIPRTHAAAMKLGAAKSKHSYNSLSKTLKARFMKLSDNGARAGSLCGIGPSPDPTKVLICYKNDQGQCHWVEWPKGQPVPRHE